MAASTVHLSACANCGATLDGPFCAQCGQKAAPLNPSLGEFLHELFHELAHVDGKIVRSVRLLLCRPGFLSREHFEGRRARYISPIRLYLTFSILYFALAAFAPAAGVRVGYTLEPGDSPQEAARLRQDVERAERAVKEAMTHWAPRAMFVLVPAFAGLVALAARSSGRNYPQHLYFALHVHAAWFFAALVAAAADLLQVPVLGSVVDAAATAYGLVYLTLAFQRAYGIPGGRAIRRTAAVAGSYAIVVIAAILAIVLPVLLPLFRR